VALVGSFGVLVLYHSYVAMAVIAAIGLVLSTRGVYKLGRNCQVPRKVGRVTVPWRTYLIWGGMLGSGVATLIPYPAFLLVMGFELTPARSSALHVAESMVSVANFQF
jgi:hypothetical protein